MITFRVCILWSMFICLHWLHFMMVDASGQTRTLLAANIRSSICPISEESRPGNKTDLVQYIPGWSIRRLHVSIVIKKSQYKISMVNIYHETTYCQLGTVACYNS